MDFTTFAIGFLTTLFGGVAPTADQMQRLVTPDPVTGGGTIMLEQATYTPNGSLVLQSNVSLIGQSRTGTIIDMSATSRLLSISGSSAYRTGTVALNNGDTTVTGSGTSWDATMIGQSIHLQDFWYIISAVASTTSLTISSAYKGTSITGVHYGIATTISGVTVSNLTIQNGTTNLLQCLYGDNIHVEQVSFTTTTGTGSGAYFEETSNVFINDSSVVNCPFGFAFKYSTFGNIFNADVSQTTSFAFYMFTCHNWAISSITVETTTTGPGFYMTVSSDMTLDSFSVNNTYTNGILVDVTCSNVNITNGVVDTTTSASQHGINIKGACSSIIISGCQIMNATAYGINDTTATTANTDIVIVGNYFTNNTSGAFAAASTRPIVRGNAGLIDNNPQNSRLVAQFDKTDATLANITGLTANLVAGNKYTFEAILYVTPDVTGGSKFAIAGTATATSIIYQIELLDNSTLANTITAQKTSLASSSTQAGTTAGRCRIFGTIVCNAAGTLTAQYAQSTPSGTSSVLLNSTFTVRDSN